MAGSVTTTTEPRTARPGYRDLLAVREYTAIWAAQLLSILGDQLARLALTVLVYNRTGSPLWAAVAFASSLLPAMASGMFLGHLADRHPRRAVMITCDVASCALVAVMAIPGVPLAALVLLLAAVAAVSGPFMAARAALNRDVLPGHLYPIGSSTTQSTYLAGQFAGYAAAGAIIAAAGVRSGLLIDAATFAASALLVRAAVTRRPAPAAAGTGRDPILAGLRVIASHRAAAVALALELVLSFGAAAEGVAVPLARQLGGGPSAAGLLLAAATAGAAVSITAAGRLGTPAGRARTAGVLAFCFTGWLTLFADRPPLAIAAGILAVSGLCSGFLVATSTAFAQAIPAADMGKASGAANALLLGGQGAVMVAAGAIASHAGASAALAIAGAAGVAVALPLGVSWGRLRLTAT
jgi:MFS family permease